MMLARNIGDILIAGKLLKKLCVVPQRTFKVLVSGGASEIGQTIALLLKLNPLVSDLNIYDEACETPGVAMDLCHINSCPRVWGFREPSSFGDALKECDVVVVAGGLTTSPAVTAETLFCTNAGMVYRTAEIVARHSPSAIMIIVTNPVNSLVPTAAEVMKKYNQFCPSKLFGLTTLDVMRASSFIADIYWMDPAEVNLPVIGGHAGVTIIPLLSQCNFEIKLPFSRITKFTKLIQDAGAQVAKAKLGKGGATLSTAYAAARFTDSVLKGLSGKEEIVECAYVEACCGETSFFANPVKLGKCGMKKNLGYGELNDYECELFQAAIPVLKENIETGMKFAKTFQDTSKFG